MNCTKCGAWTSVLQTRERGRQRECANGHRFWTKEFPVVVEVTGHDSMYARDERIVKMMLAGASPGKAARKEGCSASTARRVFNNRPAH